MFLFDLFRSFLPLRNPIGFGASDFVVLTFAAILVLLALLWRPVIENAIRRLAPCTGWSMLLLATLPVVLRLLLLAHHPVPAPAVSDEFSHLLVADTLLHFRLANASHPLHQFFETFFVLQEPSYSSIYAIGQGLILALGRMLFAHPWGGVALATAALCSLCYWMLRAWTTPVWALAGGLLCVMQFGPLNQWMNSYWCGSLPAAAGCLVFGALPRLREAGRARDAALLGLGLGISFLTRPYESVFLMLSVLLFFVPSPRALIRCVPVVALAVAPAIVLTLAQNKQVTGSWTTLPYVLSRYQYGVPTTFTFQPVPVPHRRLTPEQQLDYDVQSAVHGKEPDSPGRYLARLVFRLRFFRFFWVSPLYLALPFFLLTLRRKRFLWVLGTILLFAAGSNFYPYFYPHYIAAVTCLCVLVSIAGLERLSRLSMRKAGGTGCRPIDPAPLRGSFRLLVRRSSVREPCIRRQPRTIRNLGCHQSRRPRRPDRHSRSARKKPRPATRLRALLAAPYLRGMGSQRGGYRWLTHSVGARSGRGRKCEADSVLPGSYCLAAGA